MEGLHVVPGVCVPCASATLHLDHQTGVVRCALCDATSRRTVRFTEPFCNACGLPHWPAIVGDTSGAAIRTILDRVAAPYGTNPHQAKGVRTRFPGQETPVHQPPQRVTRLDLDALNAELDALLTTIFPDALDDGVDGTERPTGRCD